MSSEPLLFVGGRMKRPGISILIFLQVFLFSYAVGQSGIKVKKLKLSSPALEDGGKIPKKYSCDGANVNPPLTIENAPSNTKSLALVLDDIDAPGGSYVHWIVWNIDPGFKEIKEDSVPEGAVQGMNDFKKPNYGGPCPPGRAHKYVLKIYALDTLLNLNPHGTKKDLEKVMEGHIISRAQLTGLYQRN